MVAVLLTLSRTDSNLSQESVGDNLKEFVAVRDIDALVDPCCRRGRGATVGCIGSGSGATLAGRVETLVSRLFPLVVPAAALGDLGAHSYKV